MGLQMKPLAGSVSVCPAMNELQTINNENENYDIIPLLTDSGHMMLAMLAPSLTTLYYKCIKDRDFVSLTITIY